MTQTIAVARDFSDVPAGRFASDGPFSGEVFREKFLVPALKEAKVRVDLDGTEGYGSSFLEEAFGGLIRLGHFSRAELQDRLTVESQDRALVDEVWEYISNARPPSSH